MMSDAPEAPAPYEAALADLLRQLDAEMVECRDLSARLARVRTRIREIQTAFEKVARLLPRAEQRGWMVKAAWIGRRHDDSERPGRKPRPDPTGRIGAIKAWFVGCHLDDFTTAELTAHLEREGYELGEGYAARTCASLADQGYLTRAGHAKYAVNRTHPEILKLTMAQIEKEVEEIRRLG